MTQGAGRPDRIADLLLAHAAPIRRHAVDAMYADPFWDARFGERGRRHADEDGDFHVGYLAEALRLGSTAHFASYARWLRDVLVTRGMCTRHLSEQLRCVADAVEALGVLPSPDDARVAREYVDAARDGLRYPEGSLARAVQDAESRAPAAEDALAARFYGAGGLPPRDRLRADAADLISFLADAVSLERPALFAGHAQWLEGFFADQRRPKGYGAALRDAVADALAASGVRPDDVEPLLKGVPAGGR